MHIRKYDFDFSRRYFLENLSKGVLAAGVLAPLWPLVAHSGEIAKAFPDELLSIDAYTKGKISVGDMITADNVEHVKKLLDPIAYRQVSEMGRQIRIVPTTTDITKLFPKSYLEATLKNQGKAVIDDVGNIFTQDGKRWIGGNPFPEPKTAHEAIANMTLSWSRYDQTLYAIQDYDIGADGDLEYQYDFVWTEVNTAGLVFNPDGPYMEGHDDKLRFQSVWFTHPNDTKGTSFVNTWYYDQRKFPELFGYLPAFKRVRRFPTNQRFEPLVPGMNVYLSDPWAAGDPMLTWGNFKVVGRGPMLGATSAVWPGENNNWQRGVHGGAKGQTFYDTAMELIPDVLVIEAEPVGFPRAPVGKKRVWIDMRNGNHITVVTYDRRGELFKQWEPHFSLYENGSDRWQVNGETVWSWTSVHAHDIQTNRMSRFYHAKEIGGGWKSAMNMGPETYEKYQTVQAIRRLGR